MALYCFGDHVNYSYQASQLSLKTLFGIVVRDNVIFFLVTLSSFVFAAVDFFVGVTTNVPVWLQVLATILRTFHNSLAGPLMMLSILHYDAKQLKGGTTHGDIISSVQFMPAHPSTSADQEIGETLQEGAEQMEGAVVNYSVCLSYILCMGHLERIIKWIQHPDIRMGYKKPVDIFWRSQS